MVNNHEEADVILANQVMSAARNDYNTIHVLCDDRRMCCINAFLYKALNMFIELLMMSTKSM